MLDIFDTVVRFDDYTLTIVAVFVFAAAILIREITDSTGLACLAAPVLLLGALVANYVFRIDFFIAASDKDTNIVVATASGVICALFVLLLSIWLAVRVSESRSKRKKFLGLPEVPPPL